jgi:glycosyltransferase involved in cell wall biosynthesis
MKILMLHVTTDLYGSSKILYLVAHKLRKDGNEVHLAVSENGPLIDLFKRIGAKTHLIRLGVLRKRYMSFSGLINRISVIISAHTKLYRLAKSEKFDLIYTNTTPVIIGGLLSKTTGLPNIWHLHEIIDPHGSLIQRVFAKIIKSTSKKVIVVSNAVYNNWVPYLGKEKLNRIYNGIPLEIIAQPEINLKKDLNFNNGDILIGMIGRLNVGKGQFYFLQIAKELTKINSNLKFILVGDAFSGYEYLYSELQSRIIEMDLQNHVFYLGYKDNIAQIIQEIDILVLPSIKPDSFSTVILEAMSMGKPVVATAQGGALEQVLDGVTGIHIPINEPIQAAKKMQHLILDVNFRELCGVNGKKRFEQNYTLDVFEKNISQLIDSVI